MPYEIDWHDQDRGILIIRLYDPLSEAELVELARQGKSILSDADSKPLYVMVDVLGLKSFAPLMQMTSRLDDLPLPDLSSPSGKASRVAIVGGGSLLDMLIGFANNTVDSAALVRTFKYEDKAITWLDDESREYMTRAGS